mmetsp:Transcript_18683/g.35775  ORF Transcript_18683/g.35775 Transcript_18683/m.35775 type:complete len:80 (-) Transcript_18683:538-777(-)
MLSALGDGLEDSKTAILTPPAGGPNTSRKQIDVGPNRVYTFSSIATRGIKVYLLEEETGLMLGELGLQMTQVCGGIWNM